MFNPGPFSEVRLPECNYLVPNFQQDTLVKLFQDFLFDGWKPVRFLLLAAKTIMILSLKLSFQEQNV